MSKRVLVILLKYGLGLGLLAWVVWFNWNRRSPTGEEVGLSTLGAKTFHPGFLVLALTICTASVLLTFVRWFILVRAQGLPFSLRNALRLGLIGFYLNIFLPGSVGGDVVKAAFLAREQSRRTVAVASVLIDRVIGLVGLVWLTALTGGCFWLGGLLPTLVSGPENLALLETILVGAVALMAGSLAFWLLLGFLPTRWSDGLAGRLERFPKIGGSLAELWRALWTTRCAGRSVAPAMGLALCGHVGFVLTFYCAARTFGAPEDCPSLLTHFLIVPVGMTLQALFPAPGGLGGGEWAFGELYRLVGFTFTAGFAGSLVQRCTLWLIGLAGYIVYLRMRPGNRPVETQPLQDES